MKVLVVLTVVALLRINLSVAQTAVAPISQGTCDALISIAGGTRTSLIAQCTVLEGEGCGVMECVNSMAGSSILTVQPCTNPPSIFAQFYSTTDDLVEEQELTGNHIVQFGDHALLFFITQLSNGIGLKIDANVVIGIVPVVLPYIRYTVIPLDLTLCVNATPSPSPSPSPMPSETPTGSVLVINISPLIEYNETIAPFAPSGYNCTPPLPDNGELNEFGELLIKSGVDETANGEYVCMSEDINGSLYFDLIVKAKAYVVNSTEDSIAEIGSSITLQCIAIGIPNTVEYQWKKNGVLLSQETTQSLVIANISLTDIGKYECIPSNDEGTYNTSVIQLDIRMPVINISPLIEYNETIAPFAPSGYNCTPPLPDNGELNELGELLIKSGVDETANGEYVCMSEDINGSLYFDLIVKAKAYIVNSTEDSIAEIGSSITLQCIAIGIPNTVEYQWKKNGVLLSQETTQNLVIAIISLTDIGEYECIPSNDEGTYNTSVIQLDIRISTIVNVLLEQILITTLPSSSDNYTCSPEIPNGYITDTGTLMITTSQLNSSANMEYECSSNESNGKFIIDLTIAAPAYITDAITSAVDVDTGANISLWCNANGIPNTIEFQWKKDGNVLPNVNTNTYTINNMSLADIGSYECIPSNVIGTHNTSMIRVNINVVVTLISLIRNSISVAPVTNTGYTCSPFLPPGVILISGGILISFKGLTGSLNNKYYCTSPELGGTVIIDLTVTEPAHIVSLTKDFIADVGTNKSIICTAYGTPNTISYIWKKNGNIVTGANTAILSINDVSVDDIGEYECIPSNSQGTQNTAKTQVDVKISIDVNGLSSQERNILPPVMSGYSCTPPLPKGELNSQGKLLLDIGLTDSDSNEHQCSSDDINGTFVLNLNVYAAAYITCSSDNMESDVGEQVTFECCAKGIPKNITFMWKKDGQVIVGEVDSTYTIRSVSILDSGRYECIPFNSYGYHNSSTMALKVKETEQFDWLTSYSLQEKFPPTGSSAGYLCLPSFSSRLRITSEGHFITDGLYLEDEGTYICSSVTMQVSFVFHILVQGYVPNAVVLNKPSFTDNGLAIYLNWSLNATRLQPVDRYLLVWRLSDDSKRSEQTIITTNNSYTFYNYSEEATYVFRIIAQNEVGLSSPSNEQEFDIRFAIDGIERDTPDDGGGIEVWMIILIVISGLILLLICCICCFVCLFCFFGSRQKMYHAKKEEAIQAKSVEELERYRKKGEAESDESDFSNSDNNDDCSITGDNES